MSKSLRLHHYVCMHNPFTHSTQSPVACIYNISNLHTRHNTFFLIPSDVLIDDFFFYRKGGRLGWRMGSHNLGRLTENSLETKFTYCMLLHLVLYICFLILMHHILLCYVMLYYTTLLDITLHYTTQYYTLICYTTLHYTTIYSIIPSYT